GASTIVVTLQTADAGASLRGRLIEGLPASAMDTLRPANQTKRADSYAIADRTVYPMKQLVSGQQDLQLIVKSNALGQGGSGQVPAPRKAGRGSGRGAGESAECPLQ